MFGLLKKKLSTFSDKLKQTANAKSTEEAKSIEERKEITKEEPQATQKERLHEQKKTEETTPTPRKEEKAKKKTKEELAEEMEKKLFEEIEQEIGEEDKKGALKNEVATQIFEEKKQESRKELDAVEEAEKELDREEERRTQEIENKTTKEVVEEISEREETKTQTPKETESPEEKKKKGFLGRVFGRGKETKQDTIKGEHDTEKKIEARTEEKKETLEIIAKEAIKDEHAQGLPLEKVEEKIVEEKEKVVTEEELTDIEEDLKDVSSKEEERLATEEEQAQRMAEKRKQLENFEIKGASEDKRELKASVGAGGKLKGMIFGGVEINEKDVRELLDELELSLIESDVEQDAAAEIVKQIKNSIVGKKVSSKGLDEYLNGEIKRILTEMMTTKQINVLEAAKKKTTKPYRILLLGPNGAGKTTSIAKLTKFFQKNNMTCIWAAGDTFRAAAIDQLEEHAKNLNTRVVKQQYGADPAAVAFDTIKAAEAGKIDVVIIDSAGRQETNKNLMEELKKMERVAKPDLKIYVGEAYAGQGLLDQATEFNDAIGIDGFILTKIDTDAKGGTTISLLYKLKKPILFVGTGQGYDDLQEFTPEFILNRII